MICCPACRSTGGTFRQLWGNLWHHSCGADFDREKQAQRQLDVDDELRSMRKMFEDMDGEVARKARALLDNAIAGRKVAKWRK